jgi:hypothetical protein
MALEMLVSQETQLTLPPMFSSAPKATSSNAASLAGLPSPASSIARFANEQSAAAATKLTAHESACSTPPAQPRPSAGAGDMSVLPGLPLCLNPGLGVGPQVALPHAMLGACLIGSGTNPAHAMAASLLHHMQMMRSTEEALLQTFVAQQLAKGGDVAVPLTAPGIPVPGFPVAASSSMVYRPHGAPRLPDFMTTSCLADFGVKGTQPASTGKRFREPGLQVARKKRSYVKAACTQCRASHLACDDGQPCRNCTRNGCACERSEEVQVFVPPSLDEVHSGLDASKHGASVVITDTSEAGANGMTRKYVRAACSCCRKAHVACDNFRPCRACMRAGLPCEEVRSQRRRRYLPTARTTNFPPTACSEPSSPSLSAQDTEAPMSPSSSPERERSGSLNPNA